MTSRLVFKREIRRTFLSGVSTLPPTTVAL